MIRNQHGVLASLFLALATILIAGPVHAQAPVAPCVTIPATAQGNPGMANCQPVTTLYPLPAGPTAMAAGGATPTHLLSTASTNSTNIKATAGQVYNITGFNTNAATAFLKFYDKATAPTCNTDTVVATYPLVQNIPLPVNIQVGKTFLLGIGLCITGAIADNDNTNATTGIAVSLDFK